MKDSFHQKGDIDSILKDKWGYDDFKYPQREVIETIKQSSSVIAIMPTGFGKSICYQILSMVLSHPVIVISPLISLIQDQLKEAEQLNIKAVSINSSNTAQTNQMALAAVKNNNCQLMYISPERIASKYFMDFIVGQKISAIIVDEAHCISHWGRGFRPSYLDIKILISLFENVPILALTATASKKIIEDIANILILRNFKLYKANLYRANLKVNTIHRSNKKGTLIEAFDLHQPSIIYIRNKAKCEQLASYLLSKDINAAAYHADMEYNDRLRVQEKWQANLISCIVATNAFGMGINKKDVRLIVHYEIPGSMTDYVQEIGRAGRDGFSSECTILFNNQDVKFKSKMYRKSKTPKTRMEIKEVLHYINSNDCRQRSILNYFDDVLENDCGICDNCINDINLYDIEAEIRAELMKGRINIKKYIAAVPLQARDDYLEILKQLYEENEVVICDGYLMLS